VDDVYGPARHPGLRQRSHSHLKHRRVKLSHMTSRSGRAALTRRPTGRSMAVTRRHERMMILMGGGSGSRGRARCSCAACRASAASMKCSSSSDPTAPSYPSRYTTALDAIMAYFSLDFVVSVTNCTTICIHRELDRLVEHK
jgi:hypothetical protein